MAVETIRDLAFKVSLNMNLQGLKTANNEISKLRDEIKEMSRSINRDVGSVNNSFNQIKTFKAINRINKVTEAVTKLKNETNSIGGTKKSTVTNVSKRGVGSKRDIGGVNGANPFGSRASNLELLAVVSIGLAHTGILATKNKILSINKLMKNSEARSLSIDKEMLLNKRAMIPPLLRIRDILGKSKYNAMGGAKGLGLMAAKAVLLAVTMKTIAMVTREATAAIEVYKDRTDGLIRQEAFYANALKFREKVLGENLNTGANTFAEYRKASNRSLMETRANIKAVASQGVISARTLNAITGQMASFQINTDKWFGGKEGIHNIEKLADLTASIYGAGATQGNAINLANMIGKADTMHLFGQLQR